VQAGRERSKSFPQDLKFHRWHCVSALRLGSGTRGVLGLS
jgi:hypothetical protein